MAKFHVTSGGYDRLVTNVLLACLLLCYWQANKNEIFGGWYGWDYGTVTFDRESIAQQLDKWEEGEDVRSKSGWRLVGPAADADGGRVVWVIRRVWHEHTSNR